MTPINRSLLAILLLPFTSCHKGPTAVVADKAIPPTTNKTVLSSGPIVAEPIDLAHYYNAPINRTWLRSTARGQDLTTMPRGQQELEGIPFTIDGVIQLLG